MAFDDTGANLTLVDVQTSYDKEQLYIIAKLARAGGSEQWERAVAWERMALLIAVCCAGLVQYLLDCRPDDAAD